MHYLLTTVTFLLLSSAAFKSYVDGAAIVAPRTLRKTVVPANELVALAYDENDISLGMSDAVSESQPELFERDIAGVDVAHLIKTHQVRHINPKNGLISQTQRWYGGAVYYAISSAFSSSEQNLIRAGINEFAKTAALRFYPRTNQRDYINIVRGAANSGCWAYVGKIGNAQTVNLQPSYNGGSHCMHHSVIVHELNHAVGFYHEQSRTDRDQFVEINYNNIPSDQRHNFETHGSSVITHFSQPYDFGSLMHYERNAFAVNPSVWTIRGKGANQNVKLGNNKGLTTIDIKKIDAMYPLCGNLHVDTNQKGTYLIFTKGVEWASFGTGTQNAMSSAYVAPGCKMTICSSTNYGGNCYALESKGNANYWNDFSSFNFDNAANSAKCTC